MKQLHVVGLYICTSTLQVLLLLYPESQNDINLAPNGGNLAGQDLKKSKLILQRLQRVTLPTPDAERSLTLLLRACHSSLFE